MAILFELSMRCSKPRQKLLYSVLAVTSCVIALQSGCTQGKGPGDLNPPIEGTSAGQVRNDNHLRMELVWIPSGSFTMGSPADEKGRVFNEDQVDVTLSKGFWLGRYEVTQGEWYTVMKTRPWQGMIEVAKGDRFPAIYVNSEESTRFCELLTKEEHSSGRLPREWRYVLPSEAQWEYACRAGTTTRFSFGDDDAKLIEYGWFKENTYGVNDKYVHQVGLKKPNPWGLYDMHENVMEICSDGYSPKLPGGIDPAVRLVTEHTEVVFRSGCWMYNARECRSAFRSSNLPSRASSYIGFRVALVRIVE